MSRIGKMPIALPAGVEVKFENGVVSVKGPKGTLTEQLHPTMQITKDGATITVTRPSDEKDHRAYHGLTRTLLSNMIVGVTEGYSKTLEIVGVGYRAQKNGKTLVLNLGHSHPINVEETAGITFEVPNPNTIIVKGTSKQEVGQIAAVIRGKRPPEPYHGKGVKYADERIRRKVGKSGK